MRATDSAVIVPAALSAAAATAIALHLWRRSRGPSSSPPAATAAAATALKQQLPFLSVPSAHDSAEEAATDDNEIVLEQLSRNRAFLGDAGQAAVEGSFVVVVGLGGIGSHAAQLVGRTGVRRLRLVDPAAVTERSLRSHATATRADLG
eukprot:5648576-Prymnesium_polylepis.1